MAMVLDARLSASGSQTTVGSCAVCQSGEFGKELGSKQVDFDSFVRLCPAILWVCFLELYVDRILFPSLTGGQIKPPLDNIVLPTSQCSLRPCSGVVGLAGWCWWGSSGVTEL